MTASPERPEPHPELSPLDVLAQTDARLPAAVSAIAAGSIRHASDLLLEVLRDHPDSARVLGLLARAAAADGDFPTALQFADAALRLAPGASRIHALRAKALNWLGRFPEARAAAELAIAYQPRIADGHAELAASWLGEQTPAAYAEVLACVARARATLPPDDRGLPGLMSAHAYALDVLGARRHADAAFADLLDRNPADIVLRLRAGAAANQARRWGRMIEHYGAIVGNKAASDTRRRRAAASGAFAIHMGLVDLAGVGAIALGIGVGAQLWLGAAGDYLAVAALAGYVGAVVASFGVGGRGNRALIARAFRRGGPLAGAVLVAAVLAAQVVSVVRVSSLTDGPAIWLPALAGVAAMSALLDAVERATVWVRRRHLVVRHRPAIAVAVAGQIGTASPISYPVPTPTTGTLALMGMPGGSARNAVSASSVAASGVDLVVSTVAGTAGAWREVGVEVVNCLIEPGRPPTDPEIGHAIDHIVDRLQAGASVVLACGSGAAASAIVAAAVCVRLGLDTAGALAHVALSRGVALATTPAQLVWLDAYAARLNRTGVAVTAS